MKTMRGSHLFHLLHDEWMHCDQCHCEKKEGEPIFVLMRNNRFAHDHAWFKNKKYEFNMEV